MLNYSMKSYNTLVSNQMDNGEQMPTEQIISLNFSNSELSVLVEEYIPQQKKEFILKGV